MGNCKPISYYPLLYAVLKLQVQVQVSIERSAVSGQRSAVSRQLKAHAGRTALWNRVLTCDLTQIKPMVSCCLDAKREWGKPPVPKLHRLFKSTDLVAPSVAH
ncbi:MULTISPECIES: hypothetical protein [Moorena]|uniref:Uncharacterized protein n=1 Tax=Moorena bouillonii PNG TaxID=568701 RepID=A0A1U7MZY4_9CYAN|nr:MULTISPECIES: hypothetical protein [Moorena]NEO23595.1 hypothetical protein [Moorena sp. SIO4A5]OLT59260.1 hypothetical protein BJP37_09610 [Moorena bouillonii PNG]